MENVDQMLLEAFRGSSEFDSNIAISMNAVQTKTDADEVVIGGFMQLLADGKFTRVAYAYIDIDDKVKVTDQLLGFHLPSSKILRELKVKDTRFLLLKGSNWHGLLCIYGSTMKAHIGSMTIEHSEAILERLQNGMQIKKKTENEINYRVVSEGEYPTYAKTKAVWWKDIKSNYPEGTREDLEKLVTYRRTLHSTDPRLVIMQGAPGVGKTWFEKSLMTEWQGWAEFCVVADSECLFGDGGTSYFLRIIETAPNDRTRVLVIEDAPDDIVSGARSGGLGRLLGMSDGLVASSKSIMIVLSTNSDISKLDPALLRSGRALHKVQFSKFPVSEASARLGEFGPAKTSMSLADIFVQLGETKSLSTEKTVAIGTYL